jgi:hypothetical protein
MNGRFTSPESSRSDDFGDAEYDIPQDKAMEAS